MIWLLRPLIYLLLFADVFCLPVVGQAWLDPVKQPILPESDRRSMMFSYVDRQLRALEIPGTLPDWIAHRTRLRTSILELVGLPDLDRRRPVHWSGKGRLDRDSYSIEKIVYESYPGMMVPALVYIPKNLKGRAPAMISIPGHAYCEGKTNPSVQARCANFASRGIIALAYDYIGTGERNTGADACASMPYGGGNDHGLSGFSYTAGTPTGLEILDGVRAIDYLLTRSDVDPERLGFTGESGGGNSTYWVSALDERVKLAVPVSSVTTFDYWIRNDRNWDWHQRPPGIRRIADIPTLLQLIAPRPLLVIVSKRGTDSEEFPLDEAEEAVRQARPVYDLYSAGANLELWESKTDHGYQQDKRERMYAFVEKHLLRGRSASSKESAFLLEPTNNLACGLPAKNRTLKDIYAEWLGRPTPTPPIPGELGAAKQSQSELRRKLGVLLGLDEAPAPSRISIQATTSRGETVVRRLIVESEPGVRLPVAEILPRVPDVPGIVIVPGKTDRASSSVAEFLSLGLGVALVDLRGTGEIETGSGRTGNWAWFVGRPWPGMWARDICAIAETLVREHPSLLIGVAGSGNFAKAAIFAAALCPRIAACAARLDQPTYRDESFAGRVADVPRVLATIDLPVVVALTAPRPCRLEYAPAAAEKFQKAYAWTEQFSLSGFHTRSIEITPSLAEDWKALAEWFSQTGFKPRSSGF